MRYCTRCLYPESHPLHLTFDDEGVCSGCRVHEEKDRLDWAERREHLRRLLHGFRARSRSVADCIVPVSGGRDSYFIVDLLKREFGMHPLLVSYNKQYNTRLGIRNLAYLRTLLGCDILSQTVSPERVKRITRESLRLRGSMYWHCLAGTTVWPVQVAVRFKIPLIVWGVHQGCDQVGMFSHLDEVEMTRRYRREHDLMDLDAEELAHRSESRVSLDDVEPYVYPSDREIAAVGVRGIYLSNYMRWDTKVQHEAMISRYGYETLPQQRTFDTYNDVDCFHYSGLHDWIKFAKWGYGKATDHACREIRLKRLTREEGIALVARYQDVEPRDILLFLDWLGMDRHEFDQLLDAHRDRRVWGKDRRGRWTLKDSIANHCNDPGVDAVRLPRVESCHFQSNPPRDPRTVEDSYILIGRGWVDEEDKPTT